MYRQELSQGERFSQNLANDPMLGNYIQKDLIATLGVDPMAFIIDYAEKFRSLFEAHPEWREMYISDKDGTVALIKEMLSSSLQ